MYCSYELVNHYILSKKASLSTVFVVVSCVVLFQCADFSCSFPVKIRTNKYTPKNDSKNYESPKADRKTASIYLDLFDPLLFLSELSSRERFLLLDEECDDLLLSCLSLFLGLNRQILIVATLRTQNSWVITCVWMIWKETLSCASPHFAIDPFFNYQSRTLNIQFDETKYTVRGNPCYFENTINHIYLCLSDDRLSLLLDELLFFELEEFLCLELCLKYEINIIHIYCI